MLRDGNYNDIIRDRMFKLVTGNFKKFCPCSRNTIKFNTSYY